MEYMILYAEKPDVLATKVMAACAENWHPCGGIAVATIVEYIDRDGWNKNAISFYQAMVRTGGPPILIPTSALYI